MFGFLSIISMQAMPIMYSDIPEQQETFDVPPNSTEIELQGRLDYNVGPDSVQAFFLQKFRTGVFLPEFRLCEHHIDGRYRQYDIQRNCQHGGSADSLYLHSRSSKWQLHNNIR